ncbi:MAG: hypothetical protein ACXV2H_10115 [Actinomycetes bacterium]
MGPAFVHEARLTLAADADEAAPGAAVTVALCGHWEHDGACRWPHLTTTGSRRGAALTVRTVFTALAADEHVVRRKIVAALRSGALDGPSGRSTWTLVSDRAAPVEHADQEWADRQPPETDL